MALEIMQDPRVRSVEWKDLLHLSRWEVVKELLLPLPWLGLSLWAFHLAAVHNPAWALLALGGTFFFFLTGLRVVHNAYHYAVGVSKLGHELIMFTLSCLMLGSMHAVMVNHLHHHKHCLDDDDMEAMSAKLSWWRALTLGPVFPYKIHVRAFELATPRIKRWIVAELIANAIWIPVALFLVPSVAVKLFVVTMALGQCFTAFFAVWTVHNGCDENHFIGRIVWGRLKSFLTYNMFYHIEHYLYPSVPTCHLHTLGERLDQSAPELQQKRVF